jgi:beta-glucosidase/6-phospho-beta-glucosidase/beta-galactosidase/ABC-type amino acid transport substrate-binding protein
MLDSSLSPVFPASFLFGVATADHQCEAYDPRYEDIRDVWERKRNLTERKKATDFWNRYGEDIQLAKDLGCNSFRFSLAWSRLEPAPGQFNDEAFDHYKQLIETIRAAGMEPIMTLHHFTWPVHVEERGGLIGKDFPTIYTHYVTEVVKRLGQQVRYWITFNEPTQLIYGYIKPWWEQYYFMPPGLPQNATFDDQLEAVGTLMCNLFQAHTTARQVIKQSNADALVGVNPMILGLPTWLQRLMDWNITRMNSREDWVRRGRSYSRRRLSEHGKVDVVLGTLTMTRGRAEQVDFSEAYFITSQALLVRDGSAIHTQRDLDGTSVAVVKHSTAPEGLLKQLPKARALVVEHYTEALQALDSGKAAAILTDDTILQGLMKQHPGRYRLLDTLPTHEYYAAAVAKGHPELLAAVNRVVKSFKNTEAWASSIARNLPDLSVAGPPQLALETTLADISGWESKHGTAEGTGTTQKAVRGTLLDQIKARGYLVVAVKENVPGFGYRDPQTGEMRGLEIDLARAIAQEIFGDPKKVVFRPAQTHERLPLVRSFLRFFDAPVKLFSIISTALNSNWWHLGMAGKLPEFLCPRECVGQQDFVGCDYYWGISTLGLHRIQELLSAMHGYYDQAPVWPGDLYKTLRYHAKLFPGKEILIIENGCVDAADGYDRARYIDSHVREVQRALRKGVKVAGYDCWSITSNREWGLPFNRGSDFGLYHIDLDNDPDLKRVPTPAVEVYKRIIEKGGVG